MNYSTIEKEQAAQDVVDGCFEPLGLLNGGDNLQEFCFTKRELHECTKCDFRTTELSQLQAHSPHCTGSSAVQHAPVPVQRSRYTRPSLYSRKKRYYKPKSTEKLKCPHCNKYETFWHSSLDLHLYQVHRQKMYRCNPCEYETADIRAFNHHKRSIRHQHTRFVLNGNFLPDLHMRMPMEGGECYHCGLTCQNRSKLIEHVLSSHNRLFCALCSFRPTSKTALGRHLLAEHLYLRDKVFYCRECAFNSAKCREVIKHTKDNHYRQQQLVKNGTHNCQKCDFSTKSEDLLRRHNMFVHLAVEEVKIEATEGAECPIEFVDVNAICDADPVVVHGLVKSPI